jgi:YVTN family beta-propeller protein
MKDIKQEVKDSTKVFTQTFVSYVVKESTKKLIKNLTSRQKKLLEARLKNMSDDQLEQYLDENPYFKNSLENTVRSVKSSPKAKGSETWLRELQSSYEATYADNLLKILIWQIPKNILSIIIFIVLLSIVAFSIPNNIIPIANFSSNVTEGPAPLSVNFSDLSQNAKEWNWNFGDRNNSTDQNPAHTYLVVGNYTVSLKVSNAAGSNTSIKYNFIKVTRTPQMPVANFSSNVTEGCVPISVQFTDLSQNATEWNWNFGDGSSSHDRNTTHTYTAAKNYTVTLIVSNKYGTDSTASTIKAFPVYAYITNSGSSSLSIIDTVTNKVESGVKVGERPYGIAVTPDRTKVYVTNSGSNTVSVINMSTEAKITLPIGAFYGFSLFPYTKTTTTVSVGNTPRGIAVSPNGTEVYVANSGSNNVSIINTSTDKVVDTFSVEENPVGVAVSPDGQKVYVANSDSNTVSVINIAANNTTSVPVGNRPYGVAVVPDGKKVYVTNHNSSDVSVIDAVNDSLINVTNVGSGPYGVAVNPEGTKVYVANYNSNNVSVINTTTNNVIATVSVGENPEGISVSPDGKKVYVANSGSDNVSVINITANNTTSVHVGSLPAAFGQFIGYFPVQSTGDNGRIDDSGSNEAPTPLPVANFSSNPSSGHVPLSVRFTDLSENAKEWNWDFGDGSSSTQQNQTHTYFRAGYYTVTLTVAKGISKNGSITVLSPEPDPEDSPFADFSSNVTSGDEPLNVSFTDRSTGNPEVWNWDFGDGNSSTVRNPIHTYKLKSNIALPSENYYVTLTVSNSKDTSSKTSSITVLRKPVSLTAANFSFNASERAPFLVRFTDHSLYATSWSWDFGDGTNSTDRNPEHSYFTHGNYTVSLTVRNEQYANSKTTVITLPEDPILPVANFSSNVTEGYVPLPVQFTDHSENAKEWIWNFGDGNNSTERNPVHTYMVAGKHTAVLTVTNVNGTDSKNVTITTCPACYRRE